MATATATFRFKYKNREFFHVENGWCVRQLSGRTEPVWRVYYGYLPPGGSYPSAPTEHRDAGEFPTKEQAVEWILKRRNLRG